jgi:hypothetical protein
MKETQGQIQQKGRRKVDDRETGPDAAEIEKKA